MRQKKLQQNPKSQGCVSHGANNRKSLALVMV